MYFFDSAKCISLLQQNVFLAVFKPYFLVFSIKIWSGMRGWLCLCVWGRGVRYIDKPYRLSIYRHVLKISISIRSLLKISISISISIKTFIEISISISISIRTFLKISISISISIRSFQKISISIRTFLVKSPFFSAEIRVFHAFLMKYRYRLSIYWLFLKYR